MSLWACQRRGEQCLSLLGLILLGVGLCSSRQGAGGVDEVHGTGDGGAQGSLTVDVLAVSDADDVDGVVGKIEVVDHSEISDTQRMGSVLLAFQGLSSVRLIRE